MHQKFVNISSSKPDCDKPSRAWVFTLYFSSLDKMRINLEQLRQQAYVTQLIGCHEVCPTSGRNHIQGHIRFNKPRRFNNVKQLLWGNPKLTGISSPFIASCKGTDGDNYKYCTKVRDTEECEFFIIKNEQAYLKSSQSSKSGSQG